MASGVTRNSQWRGLELVADAGVRAREEWQSGGLEAGPLSGGAWGQAPRS